MHGQVVQPNGILQYLLPIAVFVVIFALRARRMSQMRPLKLETLWVVPAIYLAIVAANFIAKPPTPIAWGASIMALIVGAAVGWQRGRLMQIHVDPTTHALNQKGSPWAILFLMAIVLIKLAAQGEGRAMGFDVMLVTDAALALALGMFTATRVEMFLRARRLLDEARGARA
ncbi:CcdC protein domain-containing protein [Sphingomonas asaccharolytica]|uniref:CcdC protein domain-containing protein n=1 Tax=Sphingomonas asaccharolytica TaxID=40681 RepID=UPI0008355203|nr:CcdC protein domain-containing protein [Sphingomonas asaccharolytica]